MTRRRAGLSEDAIRLLREMAAERVLRFGDRPGDRWWIVDQAGNGSAVDQPVDRRLMQALERRELVRVVPPGERYGGRLVDVYRAVPSAAGEAALDAAAAADRGEG